MMFQTLDSSLKIVIFNNCLWWEFVQILHWLCTFQCWSFIIISWFNFSLQIWIWRLIDSNNFAVTFVITPFIQKTSIKMFFRCCCLIISQCCWKKVLLCFTFIQLEEKFKLSFLFFFINLNFESTLKPFIAFN